jgi:hypothetical protein
MISKWRYKKKKKIHAQGNSRGRLQGEFQRSTHNLHFTRSPTMVTTMGVPSKVIFEVEAIELDSKYERRQAMKRLEKLRQLSRSMSLKVTKLPSLGPLNAGIADACLYTKRPNSFHMFPPSQLVGNV